VHGQVKAGAQLFHLLDGIQALGRWLAQALLVWHQQIGIGLVMAATHPPTQLVQLGQAKLVSAADDDGVGGRHINAGFNDGGTKQQVVALRHKVAHHRFQLALGHLAVRHCNARLG